MLAFHTRVLIQALVALFPPQLPANMHEKVTEMAQLPGSLSRVWEIRVEFQAPGFGLTRSWLLWPFVE